MVPKQADVAVYKRQKDIATMFRNTAFLFKDGELVVRDGKAERFVIELPAEELSE